MQKYAAARNCPARMSQNTNIAAGTANARSIVWLILLLGLLVQSRTPLAPTENGTIFSFFDIWPIWMGWRTVVAKVPPGYIDTITNAPERDDY